MVDLNVVKYLRGFDTVDSALTALETNYGIHINKHKKYTNIVEFHYDQLNSPVNDPIVIECRGLILDSADSWNVIAYPFSRFFSYGESNAAIINWRTAKYLEKVDGSMMIMYWYNNSFHVATSGLPDASGLCSDRETTFSDLFWSIWNEKKYILPENKRITYIFELTSPSTKVVIPHLKKNLTFIGARNIDTMKELNILDVECNWEKVNSFDVHSKDEAISVCLSMNPMEQEGFVVLDDEFNRVKIKSPQYVAISHLGFTLGEILSKGLDESKYDEKMQERWMLKIVMANECSEFLNYYPQYIPLYEKIRTKYDKLLHEMKAIYSSIKYIDDKKEYANAVKNHPLSGIFFNLKNKKIDSVDVGLQTTDVSKLQKIITSYV